MWQPQAEVLFDVRVIDTDTKSYLHRSPNAVIATAETENKRKYSSVCEERRASFTPLCLLVDGLNGRETNHLIKRLAECLSSKWKMSYSVVMGWVRARSQLYKQPFSVDEDQEQSGEAWE